MSVDPSAVLNCNAPKAAHGKEFATKENNKKDSNGKGCADDQFRQTGPVCADGCRNATAGRNGKCSSSKRKETFKMQRNE